MLTTKSKPASVPSGKAAAPSILSLDLEVTGDIVTSGELHVSGSVKGDITAKKVTIGEGGSVTGAIEAEWAFVAGALAGCLMASSHEETGIMRKYIVPCAVAAFLAATGLAAAQQAPAAPASADINAFSLSAGADYSTGKYGGTSTTDIIYVPVTGKYEWDDWTFRLTVPYIVVMGPGNVVRDIGVVKNKAAGPRKTQEGLGDVVTGVTRNILDISNTGTLVDLTGKIKFGTADASKGLGTGKNDYAGQVDLTQTVTQSAALFGSVGYRFIGSPSGAGLKNVVYGEAGGYYKITDSFRAGVIFDASQAPSTSGPQREVTGYVSQQLSDQWKVQGYVLRGFANGSPLWGGGAQVIFRF